jgi:hypothetical protein
MPPLASPFAYLVDQAIERAYIQPHTAGAWATLHQLRPLEVAAAFREGRGPMSAHLGAEPGGGTSPVLQLGAVASNCATTTAFRLQGYSSS